MFLLITTAVVLFINMGIASADLSFYSGKDGGYAVRFESIFVLSSLFFVLMTRSNKILDGLIGLALGFILGILGYIVAMITVPDPYTGTAYHVISSGMFIIAFFALEKYRERKNNYS